MLGWFLVVSATPCPQEGQRLAPLWRLQGSQRTHHPGLPPHECAIHDYSHHLVGCTIFSTIDLVHAYHQILVHWDDVQKTAITTPFRLFEFPFMCFSLHNIAQTFQQSMDKILTGFDFCFTYIDDILVYSCTPEEYEPHFQTLFRQLQA